jgi:hypothetical protein
MLDGPHILNRPDISDRPDIFDRPDDSDRFNGVTWRFFFSPGTRAEAFKHLNGF